MSNLVEVNPQEFSLDEKTASSLISNLPSILKEREVLISQFNEAVKLDVEHPESADKAKEVRLRIRDNRTKGIEKWHKSNKEVFLRGGQFVDAVKRKYADENKDMEAKLMEIEKWKEIQEEEAKEQRRQERFTIIKDYVEQEPPGIADMDDATFEVFAKGLKQKWEDDQKAAKEAAEEQIRIRKENEDLRKKQQELEAKLKAEQEAKRKKEQEEMKLKAEADAAAKKAEQAPDIEKLKSFIKAIDNVEMPSTKTKEGEHLAFEFERKRIGFVNWMNTQIN